jgi:two-component system nitrate/nitrite sensor histidine kinase NarX
MNTHPTRWSLGAKLAVVGTPFVALALLFTVATLWVSWQLDGGAAAVNEAGRMRMQAYRIALVASSPEAQSLPALTREFDQSLNLLRSGDPERPLFIPWDDHVTADFSRVEADWHSFKAHLADGAAANTIGLQGETTSFTNSINTLVADIETHMSHWTAILHLLQMTAMALIVLAAATLLFTGYLFVLEPVGLLKQAIQKIQGGDLGARVDRVSSDEFGTLANGFNDMAEHLQSMYRNLEAKVREKTAELEEKRERLSSLYEVTALMANASSLDDLAQEFGQRIMRIARADGVAIRWSDQDNRRYLLLAAIGLPPEMAEEERCLSAGDCHCATPAPDGKLKVIPISVVSDSRLKHCAAAGFSTVVNVPIRLHERLMGEVDLFFYAAVTPSEAERSLIEALNSHLASAMEYLRLNALAREAAVSDERQLLARELHDSIAQSLAFLKIQVQLMRSAVQSGSADDMRSVLDEIDTGVRESYSDVRELLVHFRTRANSEDIEPALATTLRKFEHQTGLASALKVAGHGMPLAPDAQIQVLHIVQEALSNVRKHARASQVWLDVQQQPEWRFEIRDNGIGFAADTQQPDETHVGLGIMDERARRIGATLEVISTPGHGSSVILTLPLPAQAQNPEAAQGAIFPHKAQA